MIPGFGWLVAIHTQKISRRLAPIKLRKCYAKGVQINIIHRRLRFCKGVHHRCDAFPDDAVGGKTLPDQALVHNLRLCWSTTPCGDPIAPKTAGSKIAKQAAHEERCPTYNQRR